MVSYDVFSMTFQQHGKILCHNRKKLLLTGHSGLFLTPPAQWGGIKNQQKAELFASALMGEGFKGTVPADLDHPPAPL